MNEINDLIELCHFFGKSDAWALAGGGNISEKHGDCIAIKKSGVRLKDITSKDNFVFLNLQAHSIFDLYKKKPSDPESFYQKLISRILNGQAFRPSIELAFHVLGCKFTAHTHPTVVNVFSCAIEGREMLIKKFGSTTDLACVNYHKPGIILTLAMIDELGLSRRKTLPTVTVLLNHGLIVTADTPEDVKKKSFDFIKKIDSDLPDMPVDQHKKISPSKSEATLTSVISKLSNGKLKPFFITSPFLRDNSEDFLIDGVIGSGTIYPDAVVYNGKAPLLLENATSESNISDGIFKFIDFHQHFPKIVFMDGVFYTISHSQVESKDMEDIFLNHTKIIFLIKKMGWSPKFLSEHQVNEIANWDAERYRQKIALETI